MCGHIVYFAKLRENLLLNNCGNNLQYSFFVIRTLASRRNFRVMSIINFLHIAVRNSKITKPQSLFFKYFVQFRGSQFCRNKSRHFRQIPQCGMQCKLWLDSQTLCNENDEFSTY
jgi:hypothetical protein